MRVVQPPPQGKKKKKKNRLGFNPWGWPNQPYRSWVLFDHPRPAMG
jgi:hypothetical protein